MERFMSTTSSTVRDTVRDTVKDAKDAARESAKAASNAGDRIQADLESLRDDVARLTTQIAEIFASKGDDAWTRARSNLDDAVSDVGAKGKDALDAAREAGDDLVQAIGESLEKRPYTTLAVAAGIGFLLGAIWRR
jgi:ElaB/YqjD/DUF883 family membrane-anchored ribosome-binding protein